MLTGPPNLEASLTNAVDPLSNEGMNERDTNNRDTNQESSAIFDDERNFERDLPVVDMIHNLQSIEGQDLDLANEFAKLEAVANGAMRSSDPLESRNALVIQRNEPINPQPAHIPVSSVASDYQNYLGGDISLEEISQILEAAEAESQNDPDKTEGGPRLATKAIAPDLHPPKVEHASSIVRDFRNYVGDVSLPDVPGILGAADEAEINRKWRYPGFQQTPSEAPVRFKLCGPCSRINLAYGCSHHNLATLQESAESGCPCCQFIYNALDDVIQHPAPAPSSKLQAKHSENAENTGDSDSMAKADSSVGELSPETTEVSTTWARESNIEIELARNVLIYKVFDCYYRDGRPYNGSDILKFFEFCESRGRCRNLPIVKEVS